jgi:hypothetical protein
VVPAWWIVAAELGAQVDQQPSPSTQQPVTANLPIGPDRPDDLLVDQALDREPGQRPNLLTLAALPPDPLAGQDQLGTMADRTGGGHRFLVAPLQEHLPAGQGSRDGQGRGPVAAPGRLLDVLGHRHHHVIVALHPPTARIGDYPGGRKPGRAAGTHRGWVGNGDPAPDQGRLPGRRVHRQHRPVQRLPPSSRWPATSFLLCGAQSAVAEVLGLLTVPHFLQLYPGVEEAVDAAVARPPYLRDELVLAPTPTAAAAALAFVRDICGYWRLAFSDTTLVDRAVLVAGELVANAVVHARTELRLRVERRGDWLHLAVRDGSPRLLRLATIPDPEAEGGRGLWLWSSSPAPGA